MRELAVLRGMMVGLLLVLAPPAAAQTDTTDADPALTAALALFDNDPEAALKVILPAARRGQPQAQYLMGEAYRLGRGRETELRIARDWLGKAADQGEARAMLALAEMDMAADAIPAAIGWLDRAMAAGNIAAFRRRAAMLASGQGADAPDPGGALALYGVALELGDVTVAGPMADLILATPGAEAERARAVLARAAAEGDGAAMARLGMLYRDGIGGAADPVASFALLQEAVSLGSPEAAVALSGLMAGDTGYWQNPVLGLAYCLWAVRTDPALAGSCDGVAAALTDAERAEAEQLAAQF